MLASAAPLFLTKDYQITLKHNWKNVLTSDKSNYIKWFFFDGISAIVPVLFHFYVYLQTNSFATTGAVAATMGVGMAITSVVVGKLSDRIGKHKILRLAALLTGATWLAAIFFAQPLALYALSLFIGLFGMSLGMNVAGIFFNKVRGKKDTGELMIVRETSLGIGRVLVFAVAIALAILAPAYIFKVIFGLAALASAWFFIGNL
jgi:MFS family permease